MLVFVLGCVGSCLRNPTKVWEIECGRRENSSKGTEIPRCVNFSTNFISMKKSVVEKQKSHGIWLGVIPQLCFLQLWFFYVDCLSRGELVRTPRDYSVTSLVIRHSGFALVSDYQTGYWRYPRLPGGYLTYSGAPRSEILLSVTLE